MTTVSHDRSDEWRALLRSLTVQEKIELMSLLWSQITEHPENYRSPPWHEEVLRERQKEIDEGRAHFRDWEVVKYELRAEFEARRNSR